MIETLFVVNTPKPNQNEITRWRVLPSPGQDNGNRVLDPKKSQNIAILLRALNVTIEEVCNDLSEGINSFKFLVHFRVFMREGMFLVII